MITRIISKKTNFSGVYNSNSCYTLGDDYDSTGSVEAKDTQRVYYDGKGGGDYLGELNGTITSTLNKNRYVSKIPRHGENVASYVYNPPHLIFNNSTDTTFRDATSSETPTMSYVTTTTPHNSVRYKSLNNLEIFSEHSDRRVLSCYYNYRSASKNFFSLNTTESTTSRTTSVNFTSDQNIYNPDDKLYEFRSTGHNKNKVIALEFTSNSGANLTRIRISGLRIIADSVDQILATDYIISDINASTNFVTNDPQILDTGLLGQYPLTLVGIKVFNMFAIDGTGSSDIILTDHNGNLKIFNFPTSSSIYNLDRTAMTATYSYSNASQSFAISFANTDETIAFPGYYVTDPVSGLPYYQLKVYNYSSPAYRSLGFAYDLYSNDGTDFVEVTVTMDSTNVLGYLDNAGVFTQNNLQYSLNGNNYTVTLSNSSTLDLNTYIPGVLQSNNNLFIPGVYVGGKFRACSLDSTGAANFSIAGFRSYVRNLKSTAYISIELNNNRGHIPATNLMGYGVYAYSNNNLYAGSYDYNTNVFNNTSQPSIANFSGVAVNGIAMPVESTLSFDVNTNPAPGFTWDKVAGGQNHADIIYAYNTIDTYYSFVPFFSTSASISVAVNGNNVTLTGSVPSLANNGAYLFTENRTFEITDGDVVIFTSATLTLSILLFRGRATVVILPGGSLILNNTSRAITTVYNLSANSVRDDSNVVKCIVNNFEISNSSPENFEVVMKSKLGTGTAIQFLSGAFDQTVIGVIFRNNAYVSKFHPDETVHLPEGGITKNYIVNTGPINLDQHCGALTYQIRYQYRIDYQSYALVAKINDTDDNEVETRILNFTRDGRTVQVYVAFEGANQKMPNFGFSTQSAGFDFYGVQMIRTRKQGNFFKLSKGGLYHKLGPLGEIEINGSLLESLPSYDNKSSVDIDITGYDLGEQLTDKNTFKATPDEILVSGHSIGSTTLFLGGMQKSCYRYAPLNGRVVSVNIDSKYNESTVTEPISDLYCDYEIVDGVLYIRNRFPSKSRAITLTVNVEGSDLLAQYCNTAENFAVNANRVTFVGSDYMHLMYNSNTIQDVMIPLHKNSSATALAADTFFADAGYTVGGISHGVPEQTIISGTPKTITICVIFQGINTITEGTYGTVAPELALANGRSVFYNNTIAKAFIPPAWMQNYPVVSSFKYLDPRHYDALAPGTGSFAGTPVSISDFFTYTTNISLYTKNQALMTASTLNKFANIFISAPVVLITGKSEDHFYIDGVDAFESSNDNLLGPVMYQSAIGGKLKAFNAGGETNEIYFISNIEYTNRDNASTPVVIIEEDDSVTKLKNKIRSLLANSRLGTGDSMVNLIYFLVVDQKPNFVQRSQEDLIQMAILDIENLLMIIQTTS